MGVRATALWTVAAASMASVVALALVLLVLPSAIQAAPDLHNLQATLKAAQFEMYALDSVPWYFCH
jgi:hypothetical protein